MVEPSRHNDPVSGQDFMRQRAATSEFSNQQCYLSARRLWQKATDLGLFVRSLNVPFLGTPGLTKVDQVLSPKTNTKLTHSRLSARASGCKMVVWIYHIGRIDDGTDYRHRSPHWQQSECGKCDMIPRLIVPPFICCHHLVLQHDNARSGFQAIVAHVIPRTSWLYSWKLTTSLLDPAAQSADVYHQLSTFSAAPDRVCYIRKHWAILASCCFFFHSLCPTKLNNIFQVAGAIGPWLIIFDRWKWW